MSKAKELMKEVEAVDLFDEKEDEVAEEPRDMAEDMLQGLTAEQDPKTKTSHLTDILNKPAKDVVKESLDGGLTNRARKTAELLAKQPKIKIVIPKDPMSKIKDPKDDFVIAAINSWNFQITRETPVMVPEEIFDLLYNGGYNPTIVR